MHRIQVHVLRVFSFQLKDFQSHGFRNISVKITKYSKTYLIFQKSLSLLCLKMAELDFYIALYILNYIEGKTNVGTTHKICTPFSKRMTSYELIICYNLSSTNKKYKHTSITISLCLVQFFNTSKWKITFENLLVWHFLPFHCFAWRTTRISFSKSTTTK